MHFAAFAYAGESVTAPALYYGNNVAGTWSLLEAMRAERLDRMVFSSSCAVYGAGVDGPIAETIPLSAVSPYGFSKLAIERMLEDYSTAYGLRVTRLRYFNAAGADPDGEIGESHDPETHLIPLVLQTAAGRPHVDVYGQDYATPE